MEFKICSLKRAQLIALSHKNNKRKRLKFNADLQVKMPKMKIFANIKRKISIYQNSRTVK